jgi:GNAT superfamily N-acetyltransferase
VTLVDGPGPGIADVTVWTLEMIDRGDLRPAGAPTVAATLVEAEEPLPELNRFLYTAIGGDWYWVDRLGWSWEQWREWVERPEHETLVAYVRGTVAGYVELDQQGTDVEIAYFGLLPRFVGLGLGGWLLTRGIEEAWARAGAGRIWVHTCSLDGPVALANYEARGLRVVATAVEHRDVSSPPPGPWPGAARPPVPTLDDDRERT